MGRVGCSGGQRGGPQQAQAREVTGRRGCGGPAPRGVANPWAGVFSPRSVVPTGAAGGEEVGAASGSRVPPCTPRSRQQHPSSLPGRRQLPRRHLGPALISRRRSVLAGVVPEPQPAQPGPWGGRALSPLSKTPSVPAETVPEAGAGSRGPPPAVDTCPSADRCRAQPGSAKTSPSTFCAVPPAWLRERGIYLATSPLDGAALR